MPHLMAKKNPAKPNECSGAGDAVTQGTGTRCKAPQIGED